MPRPPSHRTYQPSKSCGSCYFAHLVAYKRDLLCFHGDKIDVIGHSEYPVTTDHVYLDGVEVGIMDGDEYGRVWSKRVVDTDDICDHWEPKNEVTHD